MAKVASATGCELWRLGARRSGAAGLACGRTGIGAAHFVPRKARESLFVSRTAKPAHRPLTLARQPHQQLSPSNARGIGAVTCHAHSAPALRPA
jgi:hypothetical protein